MNTPRYRCGFTLVEILIVVSIIGLLSMMAVPAVNKAIEHRQNARTASRLRTAVSAFELYYSEMGSYPADKGRGVIPPEMTDYFSDMGISQWWTATTDVGGKWDWNKDYQFDYSVSIAGPTKSTAQLQALDRLVDDGDLSTGKMRKVVGHLHYIIEE